MYALTCIISMHALVSIFFVNDVARNRHLGLSLRIIDKQQCQCDHHVGMVGFISTLVKAVWQFNVRPK